MPEPRKIRALEKNDKEENSSFTAKLNKHFGVRFSIVRVSKQKAP